MPWTGKSARTEPGEASARSARRLVGVDAARGLAIIGLMAIHLLPDGSEEAGEPSWAWILFSGKSAALFALLAGVGLALASGGRRRHEGRAMTADRVGLVVRAVLIAAVGLCIGTVMPEDAPTDNILIYYGAFFLLAVPFLHLGPKALFASAAGFGILAPILALRLGEVLPDFVSQNPTFSDLVTEPGAVTAQLMLTGTYPALAYLTYVFVGLGIGRLDLGRTGVQIRILVVGAGLAICAQTASYLLLYAFGGFERLLNASSLSERDLREALIWGPDEMSDPTGWWLVITTPHTNTPLAIATSLGVGLIIVGVFLLVGSKAGPWLLPLSAMGTMTLTLYTAHLVGLSRELHYDQPYLWFTINVVAAVLFAVAWQRALRQGPLERVVAAAVKGTRRLVVGGSGGTMRK
ncbi:DUF1624 domain-containing protein [Arthrobacter crusticola]|uniref:DUF1624 domain-containing protein n=2 Tax=Arthrobacter crusticola TaxID=2547960 RepID=A0A4R5TS99_9MICC|nr:heparan-alpha-glucosaminide N-acetyltransferase domain-containing protein [Arthrobacter crusticola]TDK23690.1 DUF1624 domain-containing protein [Arthrobacter crusticola]